MVCMTCGKAGVLTGEACPSCGNPQLIDDVAAAAELVSVAVIEHTDAGDTLAPEPTADLVLRRGTEPLPATDPAATNPSTGRFCGRCGSVVQANDEFCGICGNPLTAASLERSRSEPLATGTAKVPYAGASAPIYDTQPAIKIHRPQSNDDVVQRILGMLFIVTAALVALAALYFALKR